MERSVQTFLAILWVTETALNKNYVQCIFSYSANVKYVLGTVQNYLRISTSILLERKTYSTINELRWKKMAEN